MGDSTAEAWPLGQFDLHVHTRGQIELHQSIDRLRRRLDDVEKPLVGTDLELLARLFVDVRRAVDGELLDARRQRNGTADECTRAARRIGNVASRLVEHAMIERLQANPDVLRFHVHYRCERACPRGDETFNSTKKPKPPESGRTRAAAALYYFVISATTPAPTVRPPS